MAQDDFTVSFGSNARKWATRLKGELAPAKAEIELMNRLLQDMEDNANHANNAVARKLAGAGGGKTTSGGSVELDTRSFEASLEAAGKDIRGIVGQVADLATKLGKVVDGVDKKYIESQNRTQGQLRRTDDQQRDPSTGRPLPKGEQGVPFRGGTRGVTDPSVLRVLEKVANAGEHPTPSISTVPKEAIDKGSVDRIINAVREVRDAIKAQGSNGGGSGGDGGGSPAAPRPSAPVSPASDTRSDRTNTVSSDLSTLERNNAAMRRELAQLQAGEAELLALAKQAGIIGVEGIEAQIQAQRDAASAIRAKLADSERQITGMTRGQQSVRNKAEFAAREDTPAAEYDRKKQIAEQIRLTSNPDLFRQGIGTGAGQMRDKDLRAFANELKKLGFDPQVRSRDTVPQVTDKVIAAGNAFRGVHGNDLPPELQVGRRVVEDKVGDAVRDILERANISAADAAEEFQAREKIQLAYLAGNVPADPKGVSVQTPRTELVHTRDLLSAPGSGESNFGAILGQEFQEQHEFWAKTLGMANRDLASEMTTSGGSYVNAPRKASGGRYTDAYGFEDARDLLDQRALGRASVLARQPGFDPFKINPREEIKGAGPEAANARIAFRAIRRATRELDDLGREFDIFSQAVAHNEEFIDRASARLEAAAAGEQLGVTQRSKIESDPANIAAAQENIDRLQAAMASSKFKSLQDVFEDPEYQEGRRERDISRNEQALWAAAQEDRKNSLVQGRFGDFPAKTYTEDALGLGVIGSHLAPGTKDTYVGNLPGLAYSARNLQYQFRGDDGSRQGELTGLNKAQRDYAKDIRREQYMAEDVAAGDLPQSTLTRQMERTEAALGRLLDKFLQVTGATLPADAMLPQTPWRSFENDLGSQFDHDRTPNVPGEYERQAAMDLVRADRDRKLKPKSKEEQLEYAQAAELAAKNALAKAEARQTQVKNELAAIEEEEKASRQQLIAGLDSDARAAFDEAEERVQRAKRDEARANREFRTLIGGMPSAQKDLERQYGSRRGNTGAFLDPFKRDELGYDASLNYGPSEARAEAQASSKKLARAEGELIRAEHDLREALGTEESATDRLSAEKRALGTTIARLESTVETARRRTQEYAEKVRGAVRTDSRAAVTRGGRGLLETSGKPLLERGAGQWSHDLAGMDSAKINEILESIASPLRAGASSAEDIARELEAFQRDAKRIGEVVDGKATMYDPSDPRYGRAGGNETLAQRLRRLGPNDPEMAQGQGLTGRYGMKRFLGGGKDYDEARDAYTSHFAERMGVTDDPKATAEIKEFVEAAGRFIGGYGSKEHVDDPEFDVLRKLAGQAPTVEQPLYRSLRSGAPRFDENGMLLGSSTKLSSWTSDPKHAQSFNQFHMMRAVGGMQALDLGGMGGMKEFLGPEGGQYKLKRQYADPSDPSGKRQIYEVEQVLGKVANEAREAATALDTLGKESQKAAAKEKAEAAGGGAGGGSKPPTAGGAAFDGEGGGADGILRQILAALNSINTTLRTGVRVTGGNSAKTVQLDENGQPKKRSKTISSFEPPKGEAEAAKSDDPRVAAEAQAAQRRRIEQLKSDEKLEQRVRAAAKKEALGMVREEANAERRTLQLSRAQARQQLDLANAMRHLDQESRDQLTALKALHQAGADNVQIVEQQARAYAAMDQAMTAHGVPAGDRRQYAQSLLSDANVRPDGQQGPRLNRPEVDEIARSARGLGEYDAKVKDTASAMAGHIGEDGPFGRALQAMFGGHGFWSRIMASTGTFIVRNFTAGFVFGLTNALQEVLAQAILTESTFIRVSHALEATGQDVGSLRSDLQGISTDYGVALNDVYETAAGLTGLFDNTQDLAKATEVVAQLEMISMGALNAKEAMGALASIQGAFASELGTGVDGLQHVADVLTSVQNNLGTNVEVTAEGVGRMSGLAKQLGLSLEETAVYSAQIAKLTNQTGAAAGDQFSRILSVIQTGRGRSAITDAFSEVNGKQTGIEGLFGSRDYSGVLRIMQQEWGNLTKAQQDNIATTIGGQRQAAAFSALMNNGAKTLGAITAATYSHGDAMERTKALMNTLNKQIDVLGTNFQNLANNLVRTGLLNFLGLVLKTTNLVLGGLNHLMSTVNDFADSNPITKWIKEVGFGIIGMIAAIALLQKSFRGLRGSIASLPPVQAAREARAVRPGATGVYGPANPTYTQRLQLRADAALGRVTGVAPGTSPGGNVGSPLSRSIGAGLDRFLVRPLSATSNGLTNFGQRLQAHSAIVAANAAAIQAGGAAGAGTQSGRLALTFRPTEAQRAQNMGIVGGGIARAGQLAGGFFGTIGDVARGRGEQRFGNLSAGLTAKAQGYDRAAAAARLQGEQRLARQLAITSRVTSTAAGTAGQLSRTMGALSRSGTAADAAMLLLGTAIAAISISAAASAEAGNRVNEVMKARWKDEEDRERDGRNKQGYFGPGDKAYEDQTRDFAKDTGNTYTAGLKGLGRLLTNPTSLFGGGFKDDVTGTEVVNGQREVYGRTAVSNLTQEYEGRLSAAKAGGASSEELAEIQKDYQSALEEWVGDIEANGDISEEQKLGALAMADQGAAIIEQEALNLIAIAEGLAEAGRLNGDQQARISDLLGNSAAVQGGGLAEEFASGLEGLMSETGVDETTNPELKKLLDQLRAGGLNTVQVAAKTTDVLRIQAKEAEVAYLAALQRGENSEGEIDDARALFEGKVNDLSNSVEAEVQTYVDNSMALANVAAARGDYGAAVAAINFAQNVLASRRDRSTETQDQTLRYDAIEVQGAEDAARIAAQGKNERLNLSKARNAGALRESQIDQQIAQNELRALQQAQYQAQLHGRMGPARATMQAARAKVAEANLAASNAAWDTRIAKYTLQAARMWGGLEQAQLEEANGLRALKRAKRRYARGEIGLAELAAEKTSFQGLRHSTISAGIGQAQAERDAALAAIPQGNTVAVASQTVANAQAALSEAHNATEYAQAQGQLYSAQQQLQAAQAAVAVAQAQLSQAYAQARGDAVAAAHAGVAIARATLSAALQASGGAISAEVLGAQAQLIAANESISQAQADLVASRIGVSIAMAEAAGNSVQAAELQLRAARTALHFALRRSGGEGTAEVNKARADVISAEAAARDAVLQDQLDTIDFNVQMGRMTQSSAISALKQILKTSDLTKAQRRDLQLQIRGMQQEMSDSQWNFGDIKLPTPYQMRRYIEERKQGFRGQLDEAARAAAQSPAQQMAQAIGKGSSGGNNYDNSTHSVEIKVNGADVAKVKQIIREVVGTGAKTKTTTGRKR